MATYIAFPSWISPTVFPSLPIRWYSLMYLVAFAITYLLVMLQRKKGKISISNDDTLTLFLYAITGLILGARLFSTLLYEGSAYYWMNPHLIFWPFRNGQFVGLPGMSYHGGLVGVVLSVALFAKRYRFRFLHLGDILVTAIPLGYTFGRLGNFINGELWGKVSTLPWAITFPLAERFPESLEWVREMALSIGLAYSPGALINLPRHPSPALRSAVRRYRTVFVPLLHHSAEAEQRGAVCRLVSDRVRDSAVLHRISERAGPAARVYHR